MAKLPQYLQLNKGGVFARMALLREAAAHSKVIGLPPSRQITDWRAARKYTFKNYEASFGVLSQGFNGDGRYRRPVWYSQAGEYFRNERYCDQVEGVRIEHTGWYCDIHQDETVRGIVGSLTHGRFIAGYVLSMNDERVYFNEVFDSEKDAARMADEHARVIGEEEMEHSQRFNDAQALETEIEEGLVRLRECIVLRHTACMSYVRDEIGALIESIRDARDTLAIDYAGVL